MATTKRNRRFYLLLLVALILFGGFRIYRMLMPTGPITDKVANLVSDKATHSKNIDEASVEKNPLKNLYFGDLHVHTSLSFDAYIGGTRSTPESAYRFAKGEEAEVLGTKVKIKRPLDFAAVTDHAEFMGELYSIQYKGAPAYNPLMT